MTIGSLDPTTSPEWEPLVARSGGLFHSPPWLAAIRAAYGFPIEAVVRTGTDGRPTAGLPFAFLDGLPFARVVAAPFCDACDPILTEPEEWPELLARLVARGVPIHFRCLGRPLPGEAGLTVTKRARWHTVPVYESPEKRWSALDPSTQRAIRKARREGVRIAPLAPGPGLAAFHRVHVALRKRKYRLLAQPLSFFEAIAEQFQPRGGWYALGAWLGDRLVAGTIYLRWGNTLYYKFNASSPEALGSRPNSLLTWEGLELAAATGCQVLDLGPSDDDQPGLIRFKRQFGAEEAEVRFLRYQPPGYDDQTGLEPRRMLGDLTRLLTRADVPDEVTAEAGARLYRFFA